MKYFKYGITFIEILIYMAMLTTILVLVTDLFYQVANFKQNQQIENSLLQNSSLIFNKISLDIKQASTISQPSGQDFNSQLILTLNGNQVVYEVSDGVLKRDNIDLTDDQVIINLNPPTFGFRQINNSVQIKMNIKSKAKPFGLSQKEQIYQTTISLRT